MANKTRYSNVPTKSELARLEVGGAKPSPQNYLTREAVQYALDQTVNQSPRYQDAAPRAVVNIVKNFLNKSKLATQTKISTTSKGIKGEPETSEGDAHVTSFQIRRVVTESGAVRWWADEGKRKS